jgi:hypothetical protein
MPPRTVAEFAAHGLRVTLSCCSCQRVQVLAPDVLDATFGPDFDLVAGQRQIASQLYCPSCGSPRPGVILEEPESIPAAELKRLRANG